MEQKEIDKEKLIKFWIESSDEDFDTMIAMFETRRFNWALFVGHLMIEKLLKALFVKINSEYPPFIHNLLRLAEKCSLDLSDEQKLFFATVSAFNINARYDDYKKSFQQKCTLEYTSQWIENLKKMREWIKKLII
ncbi:MAG: HEPN domain-containing protein [Bacteroidota bacterium]